jgi:hypothetical protein
MTKHYVLTLETGVPKQLSSVLAGGELDRAKSAIWLQPRGSNTALIYLGTSDTTSSTSYGVRLEIPVSSVPPAPFNPGEFSGTPMAFRSPLRLGDFWVLGTTGDFLHILAIDF